MKIFIILQALIDAVKRKINWQNGNNSLDKYLHKNFDNMIFQSQIITVVDIVLVAKCQ